MCPVDVEMACVEKNVNEEDMYTTTAAAHEKTTSLRSRICLTAVLSCQFLPIGEV